jgi:hypothetical protein
MRHLALTALLAVPLLLFAPFGKVSANPPGYQNFGCGGYCFKLFPHIHQHGPLFNYGPYYGYYPFKPYGPWDAYLRYDPFFYGDPYANWNAAPPPEQQAGNMYGRNRLLGEHGWGHGGLHSLGLKHGCLTCGFWHASWLHGGWFKGHAWLTAPHGLFHKSCKSCGGIAQASPLVPSNVTARYSGIGTPAQSAVFYTATPTLDPVLDLTPASGQSK